MRGFMLLVLLMLLIYEAVIAAVYKWIDEKGNVHYGDCPSSECNGKKIDIEPGPTEEQVQKSRERMQKLIENQKLQDDIKKIELEREANRPKTRQEKRCNALKFKLQTLGNEKLKIYNDFPGGPREMTDKEREAMRKDMADEIKKICM